MICPKCKKPMGHAIVGNADVDATYFNNCPHCNIQLDDDGFVLAFKGNMAIKSNYNLIKESE